jgi:hypothetical protein
MGKVRLYMPLYNYIVITQGSWRKGQKTAVSLLTPAVWAGVCKSNFPTIVKEWGEWRGGILSGWMEISQYISRTLGVVYVVMGGFIL